MKTLLVLTALAMTLTGCGGGSSGANSTSSAPDNTAALAQAAQNAAGNYAAQHPAPATVPYTGSFVTVSAAGFSVAQGFILGTSERNVVEKLAQSIVAEPVKNAVYYTALLGDSGLRFILMGDKVGVSAINGMPLYAPDTIYIAKLASSGLVITNA